MLLLMFCHTCLVLRLDAQNSKALTRKIKALCSIGLFSDAKNVAEGWIAKDPEVWSFNVYMHATSTAYLYLNNILNMWGTVKTRFLFKAA